MKKVIIMPGCLSCGACEFYAPDVFEVTDISHVKKEVEVTKYEEQINTAIKNCPVRIIVWSEEDDTQR